MISRKTPVLATLALVVALAGCASPSPEASGGSSGDSEVPSPVIVALDESLDGTTVSVPLDSAVDLTADEPEAWTGTVTDESIAEFIPGGDEGSATFNPGLKPLATGTTEVQLTDGASDITFTLEVTD